jgi:hypothetical protein
MQTSKCGCFEYFAPLLESFEIRQIVAVSRAQFVTKFNGWSLLLCSLTLMTLKLMIINYPIKVMSEEYYVGFFSVEKRWSNMTNISACSP